MYHLTRHLYGLSATLLLVLLGATLGSALGHPTSGPSGTVALPHAPGARVSLD